MNLLKKHRSLLPTLLLTLLCLWTLWAVATGQVTLAPDLIGMGPFLQHVAAFIACTACIVSYFFSRKNYTWILLVTLVAGTFNLINFIPYESHAFIQFDFVFELKFQPLVAVIAGIAAVQLIMGSKKPYPEGTLLIDTEVLEDFKERYRAYDTERLENILHEARYVPEALEAARQVLAEKVTS